MTQTQLKLGIPLQQTMRLLPIKLLAGCKTEKQAMRVCLENASMSLSDPQWAVLLGISKGLLSEYLSDECQKHIPERIRDEAQRLAGNLAINQYWELKYRHTPVPMAQQEKESYLEERLRALGDRV